MFFRTKRLALLLLKLQNEGNRLLGGTWTQAQVSYSHKTWDVCLDNCHYHDGKGESHKVLCIGRTPIHAAKEALRELASVDQYSKLRTGPQCNDSCESAHKEVAHIVPHP